MLEIKALTAIPCSFKEFSLPLFHSYDQLSKPISDPQAFQSLGTSIVMLLTKNLHSLQNLKLLTVRTNMVFLVPIAIHCIFTPAFYQIQKYHLKKI